jgi:hypothetical protein
VSNVTSLLPRLNRWEQVLSVFDPNSKLVVNFSLNHRNGNIEFSVKDGDKSLSFELNNIGIAQLQEIIDQRNNL